MSTPAAPLSQESPMILVGRIGAPWGIKGHTRIQSYTDPKANILEYSHWHLLQNGQWQRYTVKDSKNPSSGMVACLEGIEDRNAAEPLVHAEIFVHKDDLPACEEGEYYWSDLVGLQVVNLNNEPLGTVSHLYETGAHDNMVVVKDGQGCHIPFVMDATIKGVSLSNKTITVDWQEAQ